jgi:hypothetical protein
MRVFVMVAAGPSASTIVGAGAALAGTRLERVSGGLAAFTAGSGLWSVVLGLIAFLPMRLEHRKSDGRQLLEMAFGRSGSLRLTALASLLNSADERRPRDWDTGLVELALDSSIDVDLPVNLGPILHYIRYQWYADTCQLNQAGDALNAILQLQLPRDQNLIWQWEAVWFYGFSLKDLEGARRQERIADALTHEEISQRPELQSQIWKSRAAIAACEGRLCDAKSALQKALSYVALDQNYPAAMATALESDLNQLVTRTSPL